MKLLLGTVLGTTLVINTLLIVGIDDEDDTLGVLVVVTPQRTDLVLTTDIPHGEGDVLVLDSLDVETDGGDGGDDLSKLQLVKDGSLTGGIESDHQNTHLLLAEEPFERLGEKTAHGCCVGGGRNEKKREKRRGKDKKGDRVAAGRVKRRERVG